MGLYRGTASFFSWWLGDQRKRLRGEGAIYGDQKYSLKALEVTKHNANYADKPYTIDFLELNTFTIPLKNIISTNDR